MLAGLVQILRHIRSEIPAAGSMLLLLTCQYLARGANEWELSGDGLVQDHANRIPVRCLVAGPAGGLLWRHISRRSRECKGLLNGVGFKLLYQPKVEDYNTPIRR